MFSLDNIDAYVGSMSLVRIAGAAIEVAAAIWMLKVNRVDFALQLNAILGLVGPLVLITAAAVGLAGLAGSVDTHKLILIIIGVYLILLGTT